MAAMNPYAPPMAPIAPPPQPAMTPGPSQPRPISVIAALRFVFDDPQWKQNILMGTVMILIPVVGPICFAGWMCETHQRLIRRHPQPMPKFDFGDFTHYLGRGLMPFLVNFVMMLPVMLVIYAMGFAIGFGAFAGVSATNEPLIAIAIAAGGGLIAVVIWLSLAALMNAGMTRAELTEDFGKALSFGPLLDYTRSTYTRYVWKTILFMFLGVGVALLGMLLCFVGIYPAAYVLQVATLHVRWQLYDDHVGRGGVPIEVKPPQWLPSELQRMGPMPVPVGRG
jgi:hypothetical protein